MQSDPLLTPNSEAFTLLCIIFQQHYYYDKALPRGCSISYAVFEPVSTFLHWLQLLEWTAIIGSIAYMISL